MINKLKFILLLLITTVLSLSIRAQFGGRHVYSFLNVPSSSRISALGGSFLAINDDDVSLVSTNPSLISSSHHNKIALSYLNYFSGINSGFFTYSRTYDKIGSFAASLNYLNYGDFIRADDSGEKLGEFGAVDFACILGWSKTLDSLFSIGSNLKYINSNYDSYVSYGIAVDVAGTFHLTSRQFTTSLLFKNIGRQLKKYVPGNSEALPFEIQLGISKKLLHAPLRISVLYNHLEKFDMNTDEVIKTESLFEEEEKDLSLVSDFSRKLIRHFVFGLEFIPTKNFSLFFGFNNQKRQEMKVATRLSTVGLSWGFSINVKKIQLTYSRSAYHLSGSPNFITMSTSISQIMKGTKKKYNLNFLNSKKNNEN